MYNDEFRANIVGGAKLNCFGLRTDVCGSWDCPSRYED